jgi:flagellin-like protein
MRSLRRNDRAISEIVGALMLVLIVVVAATSLAIFVAQYQKQLQSQEALTHARNLEDLSVLHVAATLSPNTTNAWGTLNFTVASLYINPSTVDYITINDQPLKQYDASMLNLTTGQYTSTEIGVDGNYTLNLSPREQVNVLVNFDPFSPLYSFYSSTFTLPITDYVKIDLFTALQNDFGRIFIPPTAIGVVTPLESYSAGNYTTVPVLDGSSSFSPANTTLDLWNWTVSLAGHPNSSFNLFGEKVVLNVTAPPPLLTYNISLSVTDSDGLIGTVALPPYTT